MKLKSASSFLAAFCIAFLVPLDLANAQSEIKVCVPELSPGSMMFVIAEEKGFYGKEGLKVETISMKGGICPQALLGEAVQFTTAPNALDVIVSGKLPAKIIYATAKFLLHRFIVSPHIRDISDLRGKRIAISSYGGLTDRMSREILEEHGLVPMKDVILLVIGTPSVRYAALKADSVQGALLSTAFALRGLKEGLKELAYKPIANVSQPIVVLDKTLKNRREMIEKFLRGTIKGHIFFGKRREETVALMMKHLRITSAELATANYEDEMRRFNPGGMMDENETMRVIERARMTEKVKTPVRDVDVFEFGIAIRVYSELRSQGWNP